MMRCAKLFLAPLTLAILAAGLVMSSGSASAATTTVAVGDIYFCSESSSANCTTTVGVGDTVVWDFSGASLAHTVTACGDSCTSPTGSPLFDSGVVQGGGEAFEFTFTTAGVYDYYCQIHALNQQGTIVVEAAAASTPTLVPGTTPAGGATPVPGSTPTTGAGLPPTGSGTERTSSSSWWSLSALMMVAVSLGAFGTLAYARRRM